MKAPFVWFGGKRKVRDWCLTNGDNPRYRIVLAGYSAEHDHLMPDTWQRHRWSSSASYATTASAARAADGATDGNLANRHEEVLWLSPHCTPVAVDDHPSLWGEENTA